MYDFGDPRADIEAVVFVLYLLGRPYGMEAVHSEVHSEDVERENLRSVNLE